MPFHFEFSGDQLPEEITRKMEPGSKVSIELELEVQFREESIVGSSHVRGRAIDFTITNVSGMSGLDPGFQGVVNKMQGMLRTQGTHG